jgi:hypothetical protein
VGLGGLHLRQSRRRACLERLGASNLIWTLVAALAATALSATALVRLAPDGRQDAAPKSHAPSLWRSPAFVALVAATSLIQASHAVFHGFASLQWAAKGLDGPVIGALWGIGVLAEIALFAASGRIMVRIRPIDLIGLGAIGAALRWTVKAFDPPAALLPWLQWIVVRRDPSRRHAFSRPFCRRTPKGRLRKGITPPSSRWLGRQRWGFRAC